MRPIVLALSSLLLASISIAARTIDLDRDIAFTAQQAMNPMPIEFPGAKGALAISDILPRSRSINIFASLTRDVAYVSDRLDSGKDNTTLLAPLNSAMQDLPRKPWEDRPGDTSAVSAADNDDKAARNLQRFVEQHVVPKRPWDAGKENKVKTLGGQELWWEERNGKKVILPGEIVVDSVVGSVHNGEVWALKGVVNYE